MKRYKIIAPHPFKINQLKLINQRNNCQPMDQNPLVPQINSNLKGYFICAFHYSRYVFPALRLSHKSVKQTGDT